MATLPAWMETRFKKLPATDVPRTAENIKHRAAVLICLYEKDGEVYVVLTKRSMKLRKHPGEVAFPGGRCDDTDTDDFHTAVREAEEEIGLQPMHVRYLGTLNHVLSRHMLDVIPVVAVIPPDVTFTMNPKEVDLVFSVPLKMFLQDENYRFEDSLFQGHVIRLHHFGHKSSCGQDLNIWGLTSFLCIQTAIVAFEQQPKFPLNGDECVPYERIKRTGVNHN
eukprot:Colp12_sorted_trinity150504_noHs@23743